MSALAALKAELIQKTSVYSNAHPAVTALKKRIAEMEKTITQQAEAKFSRQGLMKLRPLSDKGKLLRGDLARPMPDLLLHASAKSWIGTSNLTGCR